VCQALGCLQAQSSRSSCIERIHCQARMSRMQRSPNDCDPLFWTLRRELHVTPHQGAGISGSGARAPSPNFAIGPASLHTTQRTQDSSSQRATLNSMRATETRHSIYRRLQPLTGPSIATLHNTAPPLICPVHKPVSKGVLVANLGLIAYRSPCAIVNQAPSPQIVPRVFAKTRL
jgi:hypothetical protein